jgi:DNA-binding MarR family transcriptional regulator
MSRQTLQLFELHVLLAMLPEGGETYSVPLVLALERRARRSVPQAAVFIALKRLERKGLVISRLEDSHDGCLYFKLTREGLAASEGTRRGHLRLCRDCGLLRRHSFHLLLISGDSSYAVPPPTHLINPGDWCN